MLLPRARPPAATTPAPDLAPLLEQLATLRLENAGLRTDSRHCGQLWPAPACGRRGRVWRHQVVELLPLAVRVTEYQMTVRARLP